MARYITVREGGKHALLMLLH